MSGNKAERRSIAQEFLALFMTLKRRCGNDPNRILELCRNDNAIQRLCHEIWTLAYHIDNHLKKRLKAYIQPVNSQFIKEWRRYKAHGWASALDTTWQLLIDLDLDPEPSHKRTEGDFQSEQPQQQWVEEFNPVWDDAGEELLRLRHIVESDLDAVRYIEDGKEYFEDAEFSTACLKGLGAWDHFTGIIGFDPIGVSRRWKSLEPILIPQHVAHRHGTKEKESLYTLLDDAIRAYVFGSFRAANTLARAILELVIRDHYLQRQTGTREKLVSLLEEAKCVFPDRPWGLLDGLKREADAILHDIRNRSYTTPDDEVRTRRYLECLGRLIETAPEATTDQHRMGQ